MIHMTTHQTTAVIREFIELKHRALHRFTASNESRICGDDVLEDEASLRLALAIHRVQTAPEMHVPASTKEALLRAFGDVPFLRQSKEPFDSRRKPGSLRSALADDLSRLTFFVDVDQDPAHQAEQFIEKFLYHQPHYTKVWQQVQAGTILPGDGLEALKQRTQHWHPASRDTFMVLANERILTSVHGRYQTNQGEVTMEYIVSRPAGLRLRLTPGVSSFSTKGDCLLLRNIRLAPALISAGGDRVIAYPVAPDWQAAQQHIARRHHIDNHEVTTTLSIALSTGDITRHPSNFML